MQTLQDLIVAFRLYGVCEPCQRVEAVDLKALIEAEGGDYPMDRVRMRLACRKCRQRTLGLRIVYVGPEGRSSGFHYARKTSPNSKNRTTPSAQPSTQPRNDSTKESQ